MWVDLGLRVISKGPTCVHTALRQCSASSTASPAPPGAQPPLLALPGLPGLRCSTCSVLLLQHATMHVPPPVECVACSSPAGIIYIIYMSPVVDALIT